MTEATTSIEAAHLSWAECERHLYPIAASDPSRYQQIIVAVRALADEMHTAESVEQLIAMWPQATAMFSSVAAARGLLAQALPREQIVGAAFALREREISEQIQRHARRGRIEAARESGAAWVVLDESGKLESGLIDPYRCTEMHVASGLAVISQVQPDPERGAVMFIVLVVKLAPLTGELLDSSPGIEDWTEHARLEDFMAHRQVLRDRITSRQIGSAG
ncbi:hypothetical protein WN982_27975 [Paraburkholderia sp. IMGN_8]|uniref:hypothetical protein n=1 Tax=Paraburkholderia sp. IMGN_8 TaxID=3136564 RepID=UPI003101570D